MQADEVEASSRDAKRLAEFEQYRGLLFSVAYRMLGTVVDAEDMLQETFLRWLQAADDEIRSPRAFLMTIITRLCITQLQSARVQREQYVGEWLPEPVVTGQDGDPLALIRVDETLSMAFLVLLERLTPMERAVFLLREVFEYEYSEISSILNQSEANCRQILRRARQHVGSMRPRFEGSREKHRHLLETFLEAARNGNAEALVSVLAQDVVLYADGPAGFASREPVRGAANVASGAIGFRKLVEHGLEPRITEINGEPGVISYMNGKPRSVMTFREKNGRIEAIYLVTNPAKLAHLAGNREPE
ncbi:MAG TPA: RNA polymerase sigma-70 factor [Bryobacteraceae bacterium]|jgi:RNA polymerase sigma-70 factor (ECF subfamily)|nr:RNA polymerase sigma-70 factor [Bryobacteraceae bacterium]